MQSRLNEPETEPQWQQVSPLLDEAIAELGEKDRNTVLLRLSCAVIPRLPIPACKDSRDAPWNEFQPRGGDQCVWPTSYRTTVGFETGAIGL